MTRLETHHFKGEADGPKLLVFGAVHGNEHCGPKGIRMCLDKIDSGELKIKKGSVTFVPVCNPVAYEKNVRFVEKNLNRIIYHHDTPRIAEEAFANHVCELIDGHDILLDLHSYSSGSEPFLFVDKDDETHRAYARCTPFDYWMMDWNDLYPNTGKNEGMTTTGYAHSKGKISMTVECGNHTYPLGGELAYDTARATLAHFGLADADPVARFKPPQEITNIRMRTIVMKEREGKFTQPWKFLDRVNKEQVLAIYNDGEEIKAPYDAVMIMPLETTPVGTEWFYLGVEERL